MAVLALALPLDAFFRNNCSWFRINLIIILHDRHRWRNHGRRLHQHWLQLLLVLFVARVHFSLLQFLVGCAAEVEHEFLLIHKVLESVFAVALVVVLADHDQFGPKGLRNFRPTLVHLW